MWARPFLCTALTGGCLRCLRTGFLGVSVTLPRGALGASARLAFAFRQISNEPWVPTEAHRVPQLCPPSAKQSSRAWQVRTSSWRCWPERWHNKPKVLPWPVPVAYPRRPGGRGRDRGLPVGLAVVGLLGDTALWAMVRLPAERGLQILLAPRAGLRPLA
ncbi:hypothetical protein NDU88_000996 [Pleurodeles waltl]|uniref:Uncharacterized protein n=1 Tax=Pleurodeles waltl TaxID=8319 RepID=A0AAV7Q5N2_PLEWA|nr:hypothetical protein NDU88_000996 [Pleurodeles waltl]